MSVSCRIFLWFHHSDFLPKGLSSRTFKRVFGEQPALLGCFVFPRSLPLFFLGFLPPSGRREQPRRWALPGARSISRTRWPAGLEEVYRQVPRLLPVGEAVGGGGGALRLEILRGYF